MSISHTPVWGEFIKTFNGIARHKHRYEVFRDFVTMSAVALHNAIRKNDKLESEYLQIVRRYSAAEVNDFSRLLALLVELLDLEPCDILGKLFMELDLGSQHMGQFFTPPELSELMARLVYCDVLKTLEKPFITVSEPACGAGGMILAMVKVMLSHGHNPADKMFVRAQDIDRTASLMCYLQLALWNIPARVIVGNTISLEVREEFYTPAYYLGGWEYRLRMRDAEEDAKTMMTQDENAEPINESSIRPAMRHIPESIAILKHGANPRTHTQVGFDF